MPSMPGITMSVITSSGVRSRHIAKPFRAVRGLPHLMAGAGQHLRDQPPVARFVIDHDNSAIFSTLRPGPRMPSRITSPRNAPARPVPRQPVCPLPVGSGSPAGAVRSGGETAGQFGALPGGVERLVDHLAKLAAAGSALARELQIERDDPEQIVEVVHDPLCRVAVRLGLPSRRRPEDAAARPAGSIRSSSSITVARPLQSRPDTQLSGNRQFAPVLVGTANFPSQTSPRGSSAALASDAPAPFCFSRSRGAAADRLVRRPPIEPLGASAPMDDTPINNADDRLCLLQCI